MFCSRIQIVSSSILENIKMMMNNTKNYQALLKFNLNSNHHELIYDGFYFQRFFLLKLLNNASICWHTAPPPGVGGVKTYKIEQQNIPLKRHKLFSYLSDPKQQKGKVCSSKWGG